MPAYTKKILISNSCTFNQFLSDVIMKDNFEKNQNCVSIYIIKKS